MTHQKKTELDCSKHCKCIPFTCEISNLTDDQCKNRLSQCVSRCAFV